MKILLIEDEPALHEAISSFLLHENYLVESALTFKSAFQKSAEYIYDCILVDITLPDGNGLDIVKLLRAEQSNAGIIIISAKDAVDDKIQGLDFGADDYLPKPFHLTELNSRIKALMRRKKFDAQKVIECNEIKIVPEERKVFVNENAITLTAKEFDMLLFFISNKNKVISKNMLVEHLWNDKQIDELTNQDMVYVHLRNLRKKLSEQGCNDYVETLYGVGYKFKI